MEDVKLSSGTENLMGKERTNNNGIKESHSINTQTNEKKKLSKICLVNLGYTRNILVEGQTFYFKADAFDAGSFLKIEYVSEEKPNGYKNTVCIGIEKNMSDEELKDYVILKYNTIYSKKSNIYLTR